MLTRWAVRPRDVARPAKVAALMYAPINVSNSQNDWPSRRDIARSQNESAKQPPPGFSCKDGILQDRAGVFWVPQEDDVLKLRLLVAAHTGTAGHRKKSTTLAALKTHFVWDTVDRDVETFCESCIHCLATDSGERLPRPFGHSIHASKPNEVLHFDFCFMGRSDSGAVYVLVLKDDLSSFVRLYACEAADAETVAESLIDWFSTFGPVSQWVSDQGTHFKNTVIESLKDKLRSSHHFTLPYCPWSNGTVEVVCRELTRAMRALLSEYSLPFTLWPSVLPIVQSVLNNTLIKRLGNRTPLTAFTALPSISTLTQIKKRKEKLAQILSINEVRARQLMQVDKVMTALENMHWQISEKVSAERKRRVKSHNAKTGVRECYFHEEDFVLREVLQSAKKNKLSLRWRGPFRVRRVLSNFLFELEDLRSGERTTVHGSRVKFFRNSDLEVTEEVQQYLAFQEGEYCVVDEFQDIRTKEGEVELLTKWKGFDDEEPQWESLKIMREDVPVLVSEFIEDIIQSETQRQKRIARSC